LLTVFLLAAWRPTAAQEEFLSSDVDLTIGLHDAFPGEISKHDAMGTYVIDPAVNVPGDLANNIIDGLHDFGNPQWLFSLKPSSNNDLGGLLLPPADQRDVIRYDGVGYTHFFCGPTVQDPVPEGSDIDALYMDGGDLIVSFDVPTLIGGIDYLPSDLVRYTPTGGGGCTAWQIDSLEFDSSGKIELSRNVTGAAKTATGIVLAIDQDAILETAASTTATFRRGQLVLWNGSFFSEFRSLANWPARNLVTALSMPTTVTTAGAIPPAGSAGLRLLKDGGGNLDLSWSPSCLRGDTDYAIYEGDFGDFTSHSAKTCSTGGLTSANVVSGSGGSQYYLVVPLSETREGSYGTMKNDTVLTERPQGVASCLVQEIIGACPSNVLVNGGMEDWTTPTDPANWFESTNGGPVEQETDPAHVIERAFAARLTRTGSGLVRIWKGNLPLTPGQDYTLSLSAKFDRIDSNAVQIRVVNATAGQELRSDGSWMAGTNSLNFALTTSYQTLSVPFTHDPGFAPTDDIRIFIAHRFSSVIGTVLWLDDVRIEE